MPTFRVERTDGYTVMSNTHLRDKSLSLKAKGLLSFMLSLPPDWDYSLAGLVACNKDKVDSVRTALNELKEKGYVEINRERLSDGTLNGTTYNIYEQPRRKNPMSEKPILEKPILEKPTQINTKRNNYLKNKLLTKEADPFHVEDEGLRQALKDFAEMRKKIRKPLTERAKTLCLSKLSKLSPDVKEQIAIVEQSIEHGWQTFYELKGERNGQGTQGYRRPSTKDPRFRSVKDCEEAFGGFR